MPLTSSNAVRQLSNGSNQGTALGRSAADPIAFYGVTPRGQPTGATSNAPITASTISLSAALTGSTAGVGFSTAALFNAFLSTVVFLQADVQALSTNLNALTQASGGLGLTPTEAPLNVLSLAPIAWFRFGVGITNAAGVSQWADQSGNGNHLTQTTGASQPTLQADKSILFDGVSDFLKATAFTLNQPETTYILFRQITWAGNVIHDGNVTAAMRLLQNNATPEIDIRLTATVAGPAPPLNTLCVIASVFNTASSSIQLNTAVPFTGNPGVTNAGGLTLGANGGGTAQSNIEVRELIVFPVAHDAATRGRVIRYLGSVGGITV